MSVNTDKPLPRGPPLPPSRSGSSFYQPSQADHDGNMNSHRPSSHVGGQNGAATGQQRRTESGMGYGTASRVEEPEYYGNRGPAHEPPRNHPGATCKIHTLHMPAYPATRISHQLPAAPNGGASVSHARHWDTHESMRSGHESRGFRQTFVSAGPGPLIQGENDQSRPEADYCPRRRKCPVPPTSFKSLLSREKKLHRILGSKMADPPPDSKHTPTTVPRYKRKINFSDSRSRSSIRTATISSDATT